MGKIDYDGLSFDSELEIKYYLYLKENNIRFLYQNVYKKNPININLGRRKNYTPDFIVFDDINKIITITELKGYAKWSANEDNNIMDFMINKVNYDKDFLINWLEKIGINTTNWEIEYKRLKHLNNFGFVDFYFKNPNSISNKRREKIIELEKELKDLKEFKKDTIRYFEYLKKENAGLKLTKPQRIWKHNYELENGLI